MPNLASIQDVVRNRLCISCGACASAAPPGTIEMIPDEGRGVLLPRIADRSRVTGSAKELAVCPAKGLPIRKMGRELFPSAEHDTPELGRYVSAIAAHSTNPAVLENAASGGVMTEIAWYLLESGRVDGVTATRFVYGPAGPRTECYVARSREELLDAQGSKYCPTSTNQLVRECAETGGRYLFVGTPCQIAALRLAVGEQPDLAESFPLTMANFCGGYCDFRSLDDIISAQGLDPSQIDYFRFRGGGQPGSMRATATDGRSVSYPYPDYLAFSSIQKQNRCVFCVDATGELADFACGDAWIPRFLEDEYPWSIILARAPAAQETIEELRSVGRIRTAEVQFEEIRDSQASNLSSKRDRQYKRMRICRAFGIALPEWDVDLPTEGSTYLAELLVLFGKTAIGLRLRSLRRAILGRLRPERR
jgi:coenzyme F420 hydrogenase subunit beta